MKLDLPSQMQDAAGRERLAPAFHAFLEAVRRTLLGQAATLAGQGAIPQLPAFDISSLPDATAFPRGMIYVTGWSGNERLAVSNGLIWTWADGTPV